VLYVVAYDVSDDKVRLRMSQVLLRFGERVQESVFECRLSRSQLDRMVNECGQELRSDSAAHMRVYQICQTCERAAFGLGAVKRSVLANPAIIV
jgi:CRISPR-associated protein Cas2